LKHSNKITLLTQINDVFSDMRNGWDRRELWLLLGWRDVLLRYRRSSIGPFWITVSMGIMAAALGSLYSRILNIDPFTYIPYLVLGWSTWYLISAFVIESCQVFISNAAAIKEINAPKSIYVFRAVWRNLIIFSYNILIYLVIVFGFQVWPTYAIFLIIPAMIIYLANGVWLGFLLGLLNVRHRDIAQMVGNVMRLMFFVTPIIWSADSGRVPAAVIDYNPFYYFIEIIRAPLLGTAPSLYVWGVVSLITIFGWLITLVIYSRHHSRISFWV